MEKVKKCRGLAPDKLTGIKLKKPAQYAAGAKGVQVALQFAFKEIGPIKALRTLAKLNQKDGFDCPGCAWPDPDDKRSVLGEYCENGAKAVAEEATKKKVGPSFFKNHSISQLANWSDYQLGKSGRLTHPLINRNGSDYFEEISWSKAFEAISQTLCSLSSPNESIFYTSGRSSNEAAFLWGLFARVFGTNNMPDCSNMCHESSGVALSQTTGIGKGSVTLNDFEKAEVIIVAGQNPGTNHPRMLSALQKCKLNGGKIISINPLEEAGLIRFKNPQKPGDYISRGTKLTDIFLQIKVNSDMALMKAILKKLYKLDKDLGEIFDHDFINKYTNGFKKTMDSLDKYDLNELINLTGVSEQIIDEAIEILAPAKKIIVCWAMGLTQHKNSVDTIKEFVNLLLAKGSIGIEGGGTCPVRGHSNVQGDRTVGIMHHVSKPLNKALKDEFDIDSPDQEGYDTVHAIQAMFNQKAKVFMALGGNLVSAASDTLYTTEAIGNCDLVVNISTKLNRSHLVTGKTSIILPTLGRSEIDLKNGQERKVTVENSMGKVHYSRGHLQPASKHLLSEVEIVCNIAHKTLTPNSKIEWLKLGNDYDQIRNHISNVISGFTNYNAKLGLDGFYLPNNARSGDFSKLPNGKAQFSVCNLDPIILKDDELLLTTIRSHDQFNTTIYGLDDRYRGIYNERRVILMNEKDMINFELRKLDLVCLESTYSNKTRSVTNFHVVPYNIPQKNIAGYFPELNPLVPIDQIADQSNTPISKSIKVKISKM